MEWLQKSEIVIAVISSATAVAVAAITAKKTVEPVKRQVEKALNTTLSTSAVLREWEAARLTVEELLRETEIDRFYVFQALSDAGGEAYATYLCQIRTDGHVPVDYVRYPLDRDYMSRLGRTFKTGAIDFTVAKVPETDIERLYSAEGVKSSTWCKIVEDKTIDGKIDVYVYCSMSSTTQDRICKDTKAECKIVAARIASVFNTINDLKR